MIPTHRIINPASDQSNADLRQKIHKMYFSDQIKASIPYDIRNGSSCWLPAGW